MSLLEERDRLQARLDAAVERVEDERSRIRRTGKTAGVEVTEELAGLRANRRFNEARTPEQVEEHREASKRFCKAVTEKGLLLEPVHSPLGWAVAVVADTTTPELREANAERREAADALHAFEREQGEALAAEVRAAEAEAIRAALAGDDPDAIRRAINGEPVALTTAG